MEPATLLIFGELYWPYLLGAFALGLAAGWLRPPEPADPSGAGGTG